MTDSDLRAAPVGWHCVTPRIVVYDAASLVEFVAAVFHGTRSLQSAAPAIVEIGDSKIMISEAGERSPKAAFLYVYVADASAAYRRALELGATSIEAPFDTPYGDHRCMIADKWGNTWQIANQLRASGVA